VIGAAGFITRLPPAPITARPPFVSIDWLNSSFTVLPMQMYNWTSDPDPALQSLAATTGLVLIVVTLSINAAAIALRYRVRKKLKW
jgi:phosphate transport system permease protein